MVGARLTTSSLVVVSLSCALAPPLRATEPDASSARSPVKEARQKSAEEMVTDAATPHWSDILKDRRIGCWRLDVGGSLRERFEYQDDFNIKRYGDPVLASDAFVLQRFRLDLNLRHRKDSRFYVQLQDARAFGINFSKHDFTLGCPYWNYMDLRQAYIERLPGKSLPLGFKIGRQAIFYRDTRVWGPGEWGNVGRYTWDAAKLILDVPVAQVDFIFGDRIKYDPDSFDGDHYQFHAYAAYAMLKKLPFDLDLFYIKKESHGNYVISADGETVDLDISTFGLYVDGKCWEQWDYGGTFAHTFGTRDGATVEAYGANARLGYTFDVPWKFRIGGEFSYGSGDPDPGSGRYRTFDGLFGAIDSKYGWMNIFAWMNLQDYQMTLSAKPTDAIDLLLDYHFFRLDQAQDAWYYGNGRPQRQDPTGAAGTELGHEIDLIVKYKWSDHCRFRAGYSHFFPGTFIRRTGPSPDADWVYVQWMYEF